MKYLLNKPRIVGMYLSEYGNIYNDMNKRTFINKDEFAGYIPVLNLFSINSNEDVKFADGLNKDNEIVSYNRAISSQKLGPTIARKKKLDVTHNDLVVGPVYLFLNFTRYNVTVTEKGEFRKTFLPLVNDKLQEFSGKLIVLTIRNFNSPKLIQDITGSSNYLETLYEKLKMRSTDELEEVKEVLLYLKENWSNAKFTDSMSVSNSIKVVSSIEVDENELSADSEKTVYLSSRNLLISLETILDVPEHPETTNSLLGTREIQSLVKNNSFICYIVDNGDFLGDRYINIAGVVKRINKTKNPSLVNGLYMITTDDRGESHSEIVCKIEDIDKSDYVYKSVEEANIGANRKDQYRDTVDLAKRELEALKVDKNTEILELKAHFEKELRNQSLEHEKRMSELKLEQERKKASREEHALRLKSEYEEDKYYLDRRSHMSKVDYEERKYERDNTLEVIKTIGGIAGLIAGGFVLYGKVAGK